MMQVLMALWVLCGDQLIHLGLGDVKVQERDLLFTRIIGKFEIRRKIIKISHKCSHFFLP